VSLLKLVFDLLTLDGEFNNITVSGTGHAVAQLVEELCYKLEGRGFESRW
jgi:hypothetical protein